MTVDHIPSYIVDSKIECMASEIVKLTGGQHPLCLIGVMKGGLWTMYRLLAALGLYHCGQDVIIGHIGFSSYNQMMHSQEMRCTYSLDLSPDDMRGRHVWVIDDIYDTGATIEAALASINKLKPNECLLNVATLVTKQPSRPEVHGFVVNKNQFVVGCGMGIGELQRSQPFITTVPTTHREID